MAVTVTNVLAETDANNPAETYTTAALALTAVRFYVLAVTWRNAVAAAPVSPITVTQTGVTWDLVGSSFGWGGSSRRAVAVYRTQPGANVTAATITIDLNGTEQFNAISVAVDEFDGTVDDSANNGAAVAVQGGAPAEGADTTPVATLAAFTDTANATYGVMAAVGDTAETYTVGAGFTEVTNQHPGVNSTYRQATQFRADNDTTVDGTLSVSRPWRMFGFELDAAGGVTVPLGQAAETDTARSLSTTKTSALAQASELDSAQALTFTKTGALSQASELDSARALMISKTFTHGVATEVDTARLLMATKSAILGRAGETDAAFSLLIAADAGPDLNPLRFTFLEGAGSAYIEEGAGSAYIEEGAGSAYIEEASVTHIEADSRGDGGYFGGYIEGY